MAPPREAYCTLLTSDDYLPGALVLAHSLRDNGTQKQLAVLVTLDSLHSSSIDELRNVYDHIIAVDRIVNRAPANLLLMNRPDLNATFTKIALWRQTQFDHIVYIDADVVALRAPDELFRQTARFAAAPDVGWPDCFNSGVLSLKPNMGDYYALRALADRGISFDGADQGLLNMHFRGWEHLSFTYNCTPSANYQYEPAYRYFQNSINMVHFIGYDKPWVVGRWYTGGSAVYAELLGRWWAVYDKHFRMQAAAAISGQAPPASETVQQYVTGEPSVADYGYSSSTPAPPPQHVEHESEHQPPPPAHNPEPPTSNEEQHHHPPAQEQRRYSVDWNPQHQAPPLDSRPEAANFPTQIYSMSQDSALFQPPVNPEPPKNMYYEVPPPPPTPNVPPPPIFPWQEYQTPATRVFPDDPPPPPPPPPPPAPEPELEPEPQLELKSEPQPERRLESQSERKAEPQPEIMPLSMPETKPASKSEGKPERQPVPEPESEPESQSVPELEPSEITTSATTGDDEENESVSPTTPVARGPPPPPADFASYVRTNVWDEHPGISQYMAKVEERRRARLKLLLPQSQPPDSGSAPVAESVTSPPLEADPSQPPVIKKRPGLRLTDFPTEFERPSLPVTPAAVRRPSFWGAERDEAGDLPPAEGVPDQTDWDPDEKLSELARRQSEVLEKGPVTSDPLSPGGGDTETKDIPDREVLDSASVPPPPPLRQQSSNTTTETAAEAAKDGEGTSALQQHSDTSSSEPAAKTVNDGEGASDVTAG